MSEKKSMKAKATSEKHAVKKLEELNPAIEVQLAVEQTKPREINWDLVGFTSAAITFLGAGILFIVGWAYESNWYEYFDVDVSQLNISLQQYLVHSVVAIANSVTLLLLSIFFYLFLKIAYLTIQSVSTKISRDFSISMSDGLGIMIVYVGNVVWHLFPQGFISLLRRPIEIRMLITLSSASAAVLGISLVGAGLLYSIRWRLQRRFSLSELIPSQPPRLDRSAQWVQVSKWLNSPLIFLVYLSVFLISTMSLASSLAITHASTGLKLSLLSVQKVYLVSSKTIAFLEDVSDINESCDKEGRCLYGPFGLVAENSNSFYMIVWQEDTIPFHPGLFILPRNDQNNPYLVIPASVLANYSTPAPSATLTILTTSTTTAGSTITLTTTPLPSRP